MQTTRTMVLFAKGKSDLEEINKILFMNIFITQKTFKYIVIIIFHGMEYVTVNIEET